MWIIYHRTTKKLKIDRELFLRYSEVTVYEQYAIRLPACEHELYFDSCINRRATLSLIVLLLLLQLFFRLF